MWNFTHFLTCVEKNLEVMYIYFSSVHREGKKKSLKALNPGGLKGESTWENSFFLKTGNNQQERQELSIG